MKSISWVFRSLKICPSHKSCTPQSDLPLLNEIDNSAYARKWQRIFFRKPRYYCVIVRTEVYLQAILVMREIAEGG